MYQLFRVSFPVPLGLLKQLKAKSKHSAKQHKRTEVIVLTSCNDYAALETNTCLQFKHLPLVLSERTNKSKVPVDWMESASVTDQTYAVEENAMQRTSTVALAQSNAEKEEEEKNKKNSFGKN